MIETTTDNNRLALLDEDEEHKLKEICKKYAHHMQYDFQFSYYSIYWEPEQWLLAVLELPTITNTLTKRITVKCPDQNPA
jgi:hypothetical protein